MFQIRVLVKKLLCLDCQERHGTLDATFERGPDANVYDPRSLVCPRCGEVNTLPEVGVEIRDMSGRRSQST